MGFEGSPRLDVPFQSPSTFGLIQSYIFPLILQFAAEYSF